MNPTCVRNLSLLASVIPELLRRETPQFISPDMWPANSCDLNPVDYSVWGILQTALVSSTTLRYGRVAEASYCDMG